MILIIVLLSLIINLSYSQNPNWINYTYGQDVRSIVFALDHVWLGTYGGLVKFDTITGEMEFYNKANSELPENQIWSMVSDNNGNLWIGTRDGGLVKYDGNNWTIYNQQNSGLLSNWVLDITFDSQGIMWIGSANNGLGKFDGSNWNYFNTTNSGLPNNRVNVISVDGDENIWAGTEGGGIAKFDGTIWTVYNQGNSGLISPYIRSIFFRLTGKHVGRDTGRTCQI